MFHEWNRNCLLSLFFSWKKWIDEKYSSIENLEQDSRGLVVRKGCSSSGESDIALLVTLVCHQAGYDFLAAPRAL